MRTSVWVPAQVDFVVLFSSNCQSFDEIVNYVSKIVALFVFKKHFHFGSDTSDYIMMFDSSLMKTGIQLSPPISLILHLSHVPHEEV